MNIPIPMLMGGEVPSVGGVVVEYGQKELVSGENTGRSALLFTMEIGYFALFSPLPFPAWNIMFANCCWWW